MKTEIFLFLVLMGASFAQLLTNVGEGIALNAYVDCSEKALHFESNASEGLALLMYGDLLIDKKEGNLSSGKLGFYGKLNLITLPFTFRMESGDAYRIVEFSVDECESADSISLVEEISPEEVPANDTEEALPEKVEESTPEKKNESQPQPEPPEKGEQEVPVEIVERSWLDSLIESIKAFLRSIGIGI